MKWAIGRLTDYCEAEYEAAYKDLSLSRKMRINRLKLEKDKKRSLLGEILLKKLLKEEKVVAEILSSDNGKPYLSDDSFCVSISHSGEMAAVALSDNAIGIDVEEIREITPELIKKVCTEKEKEYIESSEDKNSAFLEVWTAKEAYFKKQGTGITNLKSVEIFDLKRELIEIDGYILQIVY